MKKAKKQSNMFTIRFNTKLFKIDSWTILELPMSASAKLPSRAMTMIEGKINDFYFKTALEPNGKGGHWFRFNKSMQNETGLVAGDTVTLEIQSTKEWYEPEVPVDLKAALKDVPKAHTLWMDITANALGIGFVGYALPNNRKHVNAESRRLSQN